MPSTRPLPSDLSPGELQAAWAEVCEPSWPTLAELQRSLARYHQVRAAALRRRQPVMPPHTAAHTAQHPAARSPSTPRGIDRKRLAAGERDDD